jgi:putative tryptophan/tyrosine transport system substrate-binding protein
MRLSAVGLIVIFGIGILLTPLVVAAQQPGHIPRIGYLSFADSGCPDPHRVNNRPFLQGLHDLGYIEGQNITFECRAAGGRDDRLPEVAAELVRLKVDVLVALPHAAALAARDATHTIPIVMAVSGLPVESGLVASLARPGGNITGMNYYATELSAKRVELLKDLVPGLTRLAILSNPATSRIIPQLVSDTEQAARALGLSPRVLDVSESGDFERAFRVMVEERADALIVLPDLMFSTQTQHIVDLAARSRLPAMYSNSTYVAQGGLMSYGGDYRAMHYRAATYVDKILKGAKPSELPVEQPMKFEFLINLKTAQTLGLAPSPPLLVFADEVIQ